MFTRLLTYEVHFVRRFTSEVFSPGAIELNCQSVLKSPERQWVRFIQYLKGINECLREHCILWDGLQNQPHN